MTTRFILLAAILVGFVTFTNAQPLPAMSPANIALPGKPFGVVVSQDQHWVFVAIDGTKSGQKGGIAVLENRDGALSLRQVFPMNYHPGAIILTHDGKLLIAAAEDYVVFFDTERLVSGQSGARLGWFSEGEGALCVYVNVTQDDSTLFASNERRQTISVINLAKLRSQDFKGNALLGKIPVGSSPVALTFSRDERWLFSTSEGAPAQWGWPRVLTEENPKPGQAPGKVTEGAVIVIDVAKAKVSPESSVVAGVPAGGSPVRLALSPKGDRLFVSARNSNALLMFDTRKLVTDPRHAKLGVVKVGDSPVPVAIVADGRIAIVGNSDRFNHGKHSTLTVLDTENIEKGLDSIVATLPCGAFPREFCLSPDGHTVFLTNFIAGTLEVISVDKLSRLRDRAAGKLTN